MTTFRIHYSHQSHPYKMDIKAKTATEVRRLFPALAKRAHGESAKPIISKVKRVKQQA